MSIKHDWQKNLILILIGVFAGIGYFAYEKIVNREQNRDLSSFTSRIDLNPDDPKWSNLTRKPANAGMPIGKASAFYQVDIQSESKESDEFIELKGVILPSRDVSNAKISWIIFKGFQVEKGSITQTLYNLKAQQPVEVSITLIKTTNDEAVVHLSADTEENGVALTGMSSFSTELDLGEGAVQKEMKNQKNELLKSEGLGKKILQ